MGKRTGDRIEKRARCVNSSDMWKGPFLSFSKSHRFVSILTIRMKQTLVKVVNKHCERHSEKECRKHPGNQAFLPSKVRGTENANAKINPAYGHAQIFSQVLLLGPTCFSEPGVKVDWRGLGLRIFSRVKTVFRGASIFVVSIFFFARKIFARGETN